MSLFHPPRVIVDWNDIGTAHGANMVSQEGFFNGCFAMLAGMLRARFEADGDLFTLATRLGVVWSLLSNASDYATRLNDDDLWHTLLWSGYGLGLVGVMMHLGMPQLFQLGVAATQLWLALFWLRAGVSLPRCRGFAKFYVSLLVLSAALLALVPPGSSAILLPILLQPVGSTLFAYCAPRGVDIPMNIEYHVPKFAGFSMLVLGQLFGAAATAPNATSGPAFPAAFYAHVLSAVVLVVSLKLIFTDCVTVLPAQHAVRTSKRAALTWLLACQPAKNFAVVTCAAGVHLLLQAKDSGALEGTARGTALASYSTAAIFAVELLEALQHKDEPLPASSSDDDDDGAAAALALASRRRAWRGALALAALASALLPSLPATMPTLLVKVVETAAAAAKKKKRATASALPPPSSLVGPAIDAVPVLALLALLAAAAGLLHKSAVLAARAAGEKERDRAYRSVFGGVFGSTGTGAKSTPAKGKAAATKAATPSPSAAASSSAAPSPRAKSASSPTKNPASPTKRSFTPPTVDLSPVKDFLANPGTLPPDHWPTRPARFLHLGVHAPHPVVLFPPLCRSDDGEDAVRRPRHEEEPVGCEVEGLGAPKISVAYVWHGIG